MLWTLIFIVNMEVQQFVGHFPSQAACEQQQKILIDESVYSDSWVCVQLTPAQIAKLRQQEKH